MKRREFLKDVFLAGVASLLSPAVWSADDTRPRPAQPLSKRPFGQTGWQLSVIGFGGIVVMNTPQAEANELVAWAMDQGVNYFDVAPTYGNAQERLGPALKPYREKVFLACKTTQRTAAGAQAELENSLRLLQTDYVDLYQLHGLTKIEEVERCFAPGGAMELFVRAREEGKVRWLGFSAHSEDAALRALEHFRFDSILFPFNAVCMERGGFGARVLEAAKQRGSARLGLKAIAWTRRQSGEPPKYPKCWYQPQDNPALAEKLLRYALDLPITATIPPGEASLFKLCVELARRYQPLTAAEREQLLQALASVEPIFTSLS